MKSNEEKLKLEHMRHSSAHLLAAATLALYPGAKQTIGPAIEDGFYEDLDLGDAKISEADFPKIEEKMHEIVKGWKQFERIEVTKEEAKKAFPKNEYKHELIEEFAASGEKLTIYKSGDYIDLCRGGHDMDPSKDLKHFKLLSVAGAYWRGSEKNKMLTRIYGTVFPTYDELLKHLEMLETAKLRDHKKLGKELDLFVFSETVGKGLPLWTPKGSAIRRELERFIVDEEIKRGYLHVYTPDIARLELYKKSGHYPYYKDSMYAPIKIDEEEYMLRPMTCPHHFELYLSKPRSYRELPMRIAELAKLYRYEKSGELMGLLRVRTFCLADAHIVTPKAKAEEEINQVLDLIEYVSNTFHLKQGEEYHYRLSLGERKDSKKYFKDDQSWDFAEDTLRKVLKDRNAHFVEAPGEAAFYGPKIDVQMKNVHGKEDTAFTVQYDFVMPKRFELTFINEEGKSEQPVVIHRSSIGAVERMIAFLIEHFAGKFPLWLAPVQIALLPISDRHIDYARKLDQELRIMNFRSILDLAPERLQAKIRNHTLQKVPLLGIIGDKEIDSNSLSVRRHPGTDLGVMQKSDFFNFLKFQIDKKVS